MNSGHFIDKSILKKNNVKCEINNLRNETIAILYELLMFKEIQFNLDSKILQEAKLNLLFMLFRSSMIIQFREHYFKCLDCLKDKDKLYFKTFKLWYDAILKVNNRKNNIEEIVDYLIYKKQYLREKRNINQNIAKEVRENKEYVDYKFDYIKIMKRGFENLDTESNSIIEKAIRTLIENKRIDSSNAEPGDIRSKTMNLNNSYMILKFFNKDYINIFIFFHELRTYSRKNNYK